MMKLPSLYKRDPNDHRVLKQITGRISYITFEKLVKVSKELKLPLWRVIDEAVKEYIERYEAIRNQIKKEEENEQQSKRN
jgi:hypothetical protein